MIRLQPQRFERVDPVEERRKARAATLGTLTLFLMIVAVIRAVAEHWQRNLGVKSYLQESLCGFPYFNHP
ncbi:hypothetical protein X975_15259, partial [Stegodyphus mimosarum]